MARQCEHMEASWAPSGRHSDPSPVQIRPDGVPIWPSHSSRHREPSWSPEPHPSPVRGPPGTLPARLRASQEALSQEKEWHPMPPHPVEMDALAANLPPPPKAFYPGTWSPRPEHLPIGVPLPPGMIIPGDIRTDPRSPGAAAATMAARSSGALYCSEPHVRHAAGCPANRASMESKPDPSSRPPSRPSSRPASRPSSRATSRPSSRSASRSGSRSASRSGHRSGYSSPGSDLR